MSKRTAIKSYCRECAGGSYPEVILCHLSDCPLWPYRSGLSAKGTAASLKKALLRHPGVEKELASMGVDSPFLLNRDVKPGVFRGKLGRMTQTTGVKKKEVQSEKNIEGVSAVEPKGMAVQPSPEAPKGGRHV